MPFLDELVVEGVGFGGGDGVVFVHPGDCASDAFFVTRRTGELGHVALELRVVVNAVELEDLRECLQLWSIKREQEVGGDVHEVWLGRPDCGCGALGVFVPSHDIATHDIVRFAEARFASGGVGESRADILGIGARP